MVSKTTKDANRTARARRNERRRSGAVCFFGIETLGFDGPATIIAEAGTCPDCLEAGRSRHKTCEVTEKVAAAGRRGLIQSRRHDGEWVLELTPEGLKRVGEIDRARRRRSS